MLSDVDDQPPRQAPDEERAVLSCILLTNGSALREIAGLSTEHFYDSLNRQIYAKASALEADTGAVDYVELIGRVRRSGDANLIGRLSELADCSPAPAVPLVARYAEAVIEAAQARHLDKSYSDARRKLKEGASPAEVDAEVREKTHDLLPNDIPSRSLSLREREREASGMSVVRAWEEPEPEPMKYIVSGLVPRGHHAGIFGDGGSGKSLCGIYLAFCVATGRPVFGRSVEQTNVVIFDFEMDQSEFLRRAFRVARGLGLTAVPPGIHYVQAGRPLTDESTLASCEKMVRDTESGLVIIDSFAPASCASDQVAPSEVVPFMQQLRRLGTVLLLDHVPKPVAATASAPPLRAYGSTYKHNLVRSSLRLDRGDAGGMRLVQMKNNFGPLTDPITFVMRHSFDAVSFEAIAPDDERLAGLSERARSVPDRILDELRQFGEEGASAERVAELIGCSKKTVSNHLSQLRQSRRVEPADFGRWRVPDAIGNLPGTRGADA